MNGAPSPSRVRAYAAAAGASSGLTADDVLSARRDRPSFLARKAVWEQLRADGFGLCAIARATNRNHATVSHGLNRKAYK